MPITFEHDFARLKHLGADHDIFHLSKVLEPEIIKGGSRYEVLYPYFWDLIDRNCQSCKLDQRVTCHNRFFLQELSHKGLSRNDLYLLVYMTTYFLDLIMARGLTLSQAYYVLSRGHEVVIDCALGRRPCPKEPIADKNQYEGYLLGVLYHLLPDFEYKIYRPVLGCS